MIGTMPECPWCSDVVDNDGDTCNWECYASWFAVHASTQRDIIRLDDLEVPPKLMADQPWYEDLIRQIGGQS